MPTRPRLVSSIPFWILVIASVATIAAGALLLVDKLGSMTSTLTDGSATGVDVYVGQSVAVFGTVLIGAGAIGLLLALTVASIATLRPVAPAQVVEPIEWAAEPAAPEVVAEQAVAAVAEPAAVAEAEPAAEVVEPAAEVVEPAETTTR